jgi:hypothetical protein
MAAGGLDLERKHARDRVWRQEHREWRREYARLRYAKRKAERQQSAPKHRGRLNVERIRDMADHTITEEERQANRGLPCCYLGTLEARAVPDPVPVQIFGPHTAQLTHRAPKPKGP